MSVSAEPIRVLHVDDEPDFAELAGTVLERQNEALTVDTATSASKARELLAARGYDCIVSDYDMPGEDGIEFLEAVREQNPELPFVLFTGKGSEEVASEAISAGVTDYLQKESGTSQYAVLANRIENAVDQYRSKRGLEASQRRLSLFIDQSALGVIEWDEDFAVADMNDAAEGILGYDEEDLVGRSWEAIVPDSDREAVDEVVTALLEAEGGYHSINENVRKDGERIVCEWHNRVVTDEDGEVVAIFSQFQDVTERQEREWAVEALHQTTRRLMQAADTEAVAEIVVEAVRDILDLPANGVHLYDAGADGLVPVAWTDYGLELVGEVPTFSRGESLAWEVFETGEPRQYDDVSSIPGRHNPDTPIRSEILLPLDDHGVCVIGSPEVGAFDEMDVSLAKTLAAHATAALDRIEREADLRAQTSRLEALHKATGDMLASETPQAVADRVVEAADEILGFPITMVRFYDEDAGGLVPVAETETSREVFDPVDVFEAGGESLNWAAYESGSAAFYEDISAIEQARDSDSPIDSLMLFPLGRHGTMSVGDTSPRSFDESDRFHGELLARMASLALSQLARETALTDQRDTLDRQNERLAQFAGVVSHDLRNPLNVAQGRLALLYEERPSEDLERAMRAIDRMERLIEDLLTLAQAGDVIGTLERVDLAAVAEGCSRNVELGTTTVSIETSKVIRADRSRLQQLLENLFRNAVEHAGPAPTITLGELDGGFYVEDDGLGIPADERERVLQAGYTSAGGTGFGLSIVREIAGAHGWSLELDEGTEGGLRVAVTGVEAVG